MPAAFAAGFAPFLRYTVFVDEAMLATLCCGLTEEAKGSLSGVQETQFFRMGLSCIPRHAD